MYWTTIFACLIAVVPANGVECQYSLSKRLVTCQVPSTGQPNKVSCQTVSPMSYAADTPVGSYVIAPTSPRKGVFWYNLYPKRISQAGYWDYYCKNPDTGRSKIAFHSGTISEGCITVTDNTCAKQMKELITNDLSGMSYVNVHGLKSSGFFGRKLLHDCFTLHLLFMRIVLVGKL
ncbi:unnamed protein product [Adineta steineri]|uniref:DUF2778 domain-containing protein n=1 Tax=Adineta steineri TaxID=433720 RepID=A0A818JBW0_9BILA|nr:unnamed protein product [Adineta steineri]CAF3536763.1 unnamed protein product [Adineta steineri]